MAGGGEMADVVVGEVGRRQAEPGAPRAAVERGGDAELEAFRPDRVVIMVAVEPDHVLPHREPRGLALDLSGGRDRAVHQAAEHRDLVAELLHRELELLDRLLGGVHRDDRRRGHAVAEIAEIL